MLNAYLAALPRLQAERQLTAIEASVYPHADAEGRRSIDKRLADSDPQRHQAKRASVADLAGLGIHVENAPEEVSDVSGS